jgi:hypothetical protein
VALLRNVDAPVLPNRVWLEPPPKAAPMSAPFPVWSKTIMISAILTQIWMMRSNIDIVNFSKKNLNSEIGMWNAELKKGKIRF